MMSTDPVDHIQRALWEFERHVLADDDWPKIRDRRGEVATMARSRAKVVADRLGAAGLIASQLPVAKATNSKARTIILSRTVAVHAASALAASDDDGDKHTAAQIRAAILSSGDLRKSLAAKLFHAAHLREWSAASEAEQETFYAMADALIDDGVVGGRV